MRSPDDIEVRFWPGEGKGLVYCQTTGNTHLLSDEAITLLELLDDQPRGVEEIIERLGLPAGVQEEAVSAARKILIELGALGLVVSH